MLERIAHATDFSPESAVAFLHALRIAIAAKCRLDILHVRDPAEPNAWRSFPRVREPLIAWGLLEADATPADIESGLGVRVSKVEISDHDPQSGLANFVADHRPDLMVLAAHAHAGLGRLLRGSVSQAVVDRTRVPAIVLGPDSMGFVNQQNGGIEIGRILMPVTVEPDPAAALRAAYALLTPLGVKASAFELVNVGGGLTLTIDPDGRSVEITHLDGAVVPTIIEEARRRGVDLIVMPTTGKHGMLDALRGSTTSHVIAHAPCPVLTIPMVPG